MSSLARRWIGIGAVLGAIGVALGAISAHGLHHLLAEHGFAGNDLTRRLGNFETAIHYQMLHAIALVLTGLAHGTPSQQRVAIRRLGVSDRHHPLFRAAEGADLRRPILELARRRCPGRRRIDDCRLGGFSHRRFPAVNAASSHRNRMPASQASPREGLQIRAAIKRSAGTLGGRSLNLGFGLRRNYRYRRRHRSLRKRRIIENDAKKLTQTYPSLH